MIRLRRMRRRQNRTGPYQMIRSRRTRRRHLLHRTLSRRRPMRQEKSSGFASLWTTGTGHTSGSGAVSFLRLLDAGCLASERPVYRVRSVSLTVLCATLSDCRSECGGCPAVWRLQPDAQGLGRRGRIHAARKEGECGRTLFISCGSSSRPLLGAPHPPPPRFRIRKTIATARSVALDLVGMPRLC